MAILVGNQRGGAQDMALHLMKDENDHVDVHEIRGFMSDSVMGAMNEAYAMSKATKCKQFIYSLSASPPPNEKVTTDDLVGFVDQAEERLGLQGQPRILVIHEKRGRRHIHSVWSRIKPDDLKAVQMSYDRKTLMTLSRDIFIERGWQLPQGLAEPSRRDPRNFTLAEWQQAKRQGKDPREIKTALQDAWAVSDSRAAFIHALDERGYKLARGDKRGFLVVDHRLEPYSLSKWSGQKPKDLKSRLGNPQEFPSLDDTKAQMHREMQHTLSRIETDVQHRANEAQERFEQKRKALIQKQQQEREAFKQAQEQRRIAANKARAERFRSGLSGLWDHLRGEHKPIQKQNELEAYAELKRSRQDMDKLIVQHLDQRQRIEKFRKRYNDRAETVSRNLEQDKKPYQHNYPYNHMHEPQR